MEASEKCSEESEYLEEGGELVGVVMREKSERKRDRTRRSVHHVCENACQHSASTMHTRRHDCWSCVVHIASE